jgi:hypothetical protein
VVPPMIQYLRGNLLEAARPKRSSNCRQYEAACKRHEVSVGQMFVVEQRELIGPKWIVNFPTKQHWRQPSKLEWIVDGLVNLRRAFS